MNCRRLTCAVAIAVLFSLCSLSLEAGVTFEFTYFDTPGTGFSAGSLGAARKASLELVAAQLGSLIAQDATVKIGVAPSETDGTGFLATAGADFEGLGPPAAGFFDGEVFAAIVDGIPGVGAPDCGGSACQGGLVVDFGYSYALAGTPTPAEIHFPSVILHELTHLLGYGSHITTSGPFAGSGLNETFPDVYSKFDSFVTTLGGTPVIDPGAFGPIVGPGSFPALLAAGIAFSGPFTTLAGGGTLVLAPSDPSHSGTTTDVMFPSFAFGEVREDLTAVDLAVLIDLGYAIGLPDADFDSDGDIDGTDFLTLQLGLGSGGPGSGILLSDGDATHDEFIGPSDLFFWEDQFGTPGAIPLAFSASTGSQTVPEPTSLVLLACGAIAALGKQRLKV